MNRLLPSLILILCSWSCLGQVRFKWPDNSSKAKEMHALYIDAMGQKDYKGAFEPLNWLLEHAPDLNPSIYIHAEKIYENLIRDENDSTKRGQMQEKQLTLYDIRVKHFDDRGKVTNRKGYAAYRYLKDRPEKYEELFQLFEKAFGYQDQFILNANLVAYMNVIRLYQNNGGGLEDEEILDRYDLISSLIEAKGLREKSQHVVDKILISLIEVDCKLIANRFAGSYYKDTANVAIAKRIMRLCMVYRCKELSVFLTAAETVQRVEPTAALALMIAVVKANKGDEPGAEKYYHDAIKLSEDRSKRAKVYYSLALHYQHRGLKPKSRDAALQSLKNDSGMSKAYKLIGDLYWTSVEDCKEHKSPTYDRSFYIAAYEMYKKAGDVAMMKQAKEQFPSGDDIFYEIKEEGQTLHLGCWINEDIVLQKRPE